MSEKDFKALNNEERLAVIQGLDYWYDREKILELLLSVEIGELDAKLLGELGKAYNNTDQYEAAKAILDMIAEEERDAKWYYRYAFSHMQLAEDLTSDFETKAKEALNIFDKAVTLAGGDEIADDCAELVSLSRLKNVLEGNEDKYPHIAEKYQEYIKTKKNENIKPQKKKIYKKITIEDIKKIEDSWEINEPMWNTISIYKSYEEYIKSAEGFTLEQRFLLAIIWYFAEVNNGGHHQFFYNSTGIVWEDVLNGFKHFGMTEFAANFQKVVDYCGGTISFDRGERWELLEKLEEKNEEEFFKILDEADDFIYEYDGEENELNYIKAHPEKFVFEGEYEAI